MWKRLLACLLAFLLTCGGCALGEETELPVEEAAVELEAPEEKVEPVPEPAPAPVEEEAPAPAEEEVSEPTEEEAAPEPAEENGMDAADEPTPVEQSDAEDAPAEEPLKAETEPGAETEPAAPAEGDEPADEASPLEAPPAEEATPVEEAAAPVLPPEIAAPAETLGVKEQLQLQAVNVPEGAKVLWKTGSAKILKVDNKGKIVGVKAGTAVISLLIDGETAASLTFRVWKAPGKVALSLGSDILGVGETTTAAVGFKKKEGGGYALQSSDANIARVSADGTVEAVAPGTALISVRTYNGRSAKVSLTVKKAPETIRLSASSLRLPAGDGGALAYALDKGAAGAVSFESSDEAVVKINARGQYKALAAGEAVITARAYNGVSAECAVAVVPGVRSLVFEASPAVMGVKESIQLRAIADGDPELRPSLAWQTSSAKVLKVDGNGKLTAVKAGTATITAKATSGATASVKIKVMKEPGKVELSLKSSVLGAGERTEATVGFKKKQGGGYALQSSDEGVVRVSADGMVEAVAPGTAQISVKTYNGKSAKVSVTVKKAPETIRLNASSLRLPAGDAASLKFALDKDAAGAIRFESSAPAVVRVNARGELKALAEGEAVITARAYNGVSAECAVTVLPGVRTLTFDAPPATLGLKETFQLRAIADGDPDLPVNLTWQTSKAKVLKVDGNGKLTAVRTGTATITAKATSGATASVKIKVVKAPNKVELKPASLDLQLGLTATLKAALPSGTASALAWYGYDASIVRVENGVVTALACGKTTVGVKTYNGKSAACTVHVYLPPETVVPDSEVIEIARAGQKAQVKASLLPAGAWSPLTYESSDPSVVTVSAAGELRARAVGEAVVTIGTNVSGVVGRCTVRVLEDGPLSGVIIGIDPGHQGKGDYSQETVAPNSKKTKAKVSSGTAGYVTRIPEYKITLEVGFKLREELESLGATVYMTRETHNINISNQQRAKMMNELHADLVLRLHCNGSSNRSVYGIHIYAPKSNSVATASRKAADTLLKSMFAATGISRGGVGVNNNYTGLNWSTVPSVLVEMGYMSNAAEDRKLATDAYQRKLSTGMTNGILEYFGRER